MELLDLFPITVSTSKIDIPTNFLEEINKLDTRDNEGNITSIEDHLLDRYEFTTIKKDLELLLNKHLAKVYNPRDPTVEVYITQSWANYTGGSQYHHIHNHFNSVLSGALYVDVMEGDNIEFHRNDGGAPLILDVPTDTPDFRNCKYFSVPTDTVGQVCIFPSTQYHGVAPLDKTRIGPRVSIAFNTFLTGSVGTRETLSYVAL
jgi:uncharacterized protein (TIGR02466 family)